jgi:hypothetical protein
VLTSVFGGSSAGGVMPVKAPAMAPGLKPVKLSTAKGGDAAGTAVPDIAAQGQSLTLPAGGVVRIVADESNNAILVMASAQDFKLIESALKRLDVQEMQVLIEASILEVSLTDELSYGLEWYIKQNKFHKNYSTEALLDLNTTAGIGATIPGFSYTITGGTNVSAVLNALATDSKLNVISSPSLMVLDNRTARITVGDQIPVRTETATTEGGVIIESIQFKDTGVQLEVKPRINTGGLITLDIRYWPAQLPPAQHRKHHRHSKRRHHHAWRPDHREQHRHRIRRAGTEQAAADRRAVRQDHGIETAHRAGGADYAAGGAHLRRRAPADGRVPPAHEQPQPAGAANPRYAAALGRGTREYPWAAGSTAITSESGRTPFPLPPIRVTST